MKLGAICVDVEASTFYASDYIGEEEWGLRIVRKLMETSINYNYKHPLSKF